MDDKQNTDPSPATETDDPPFHPPVEPASESAETSVAKEGEAVDEAPE